MKRILVVEDNPANMALVATILKRFGYEVLQAEDAEAGIRLARTEDPDAILMDLQLPRMDGLQATRVLKDDPATRAIPIVALTAQAMKGDEERIRQAGCDGYLSKPLDYHKLLAELEARCGS